MYCNNQIYSFHKFDCKYCLHYTSDMERTHFSSIRNNVYFSFLSISFHTWDTNDGFHMISVNPIRHNSQKTYAVTWLWDLKRIKFQLQSRTLIHICFAMSCNEFVGIEYDPVYFYGLCTYKMRLIF